jgi:hypothetical protein
MRNERKLVTGSAKLAAAARRGDLRGNGTLPVSGSPQTGKLEQLETATTRTET